jgi:phage terminase large subunit-like protein
LAAAVQERSAAKRRTPPIQPPRAWWGDGGAPLDVWPGVTIAIPTVWHVGRGRWESPDGRFYFDMAAADRAVDFFPELLTHHIGAFAGKPFALLEYQVKLLTRPIFGWKRASDGLRRFRKVFAFIPKGGGKSPWAAGTGVYLARCDGEAAAEVYAIANDRNQARTVHTNAKYMVEDQPLLKKGAEILKDSIYWEDTRSTYQVLSSDASSAHGKRPHCLIFDELHGLSGDRDRELFEALTKSLIKRLQPLLVMITHSGTDDEGICHEEYEYAKGVLSGSIPDETCLPVIFEATVKDDWTSPAVHRRVNPGYGVTVQAESVETECLQAKSEPRKQNDFKRYHLNIWVNQASAWLPLEWWDACALPMLPDDVLAEYPCAIAIDMAQKIDLAATDAVFRLPLEFFADRSSPTIEVVANEFPTPEAAPIKRTYSLNYGIAVVPMFWLPEDTLRERVRNDGVRYDIYEGDGLLRTTEGAVIDSNAIVSYIRDIDGREPARRDLVSRFPLARQAEIAYDPAFATDLAIALRDRCGYKDRTIETPQNYTHLSEACQVFEALVKAKRVIHGGNRLLRWNVENVAVKRDDAGRIKPVKPKNPTKRIDGVVALIMALSRVMVMPAPRTRPRGGAKVWTADGFKDANAQSAT